MRAIRDEFGHHPEAVLIGHNDEHAARAMYPWHLPCSTTIVSFHRGELVLERHGSLGIEHAKVIAAKHGFRARGRARTSACRCAGRAGLCMPRPLELRH